MDGESFMQTHRVERICKHARVEEAKEAPERNEEWALRAKVQSVTDSMQCMMSHDAMQLQ